MLKGADYYNTHDLIHKSALKHRKTAVSRRALRLNLLNAKEYVCAFEKSLIEIRLFLFVF